GQWSFFFFQAEDGIRDWSVTGVQTCALPISYLTQSFFSPAGTQCEGGEPSGDPGDRGDCGRWPRPALEGARPRSRRAARPRVPTRPRAGFFPDETTRGTTGRGCAWEGLGSAGSGAHRISCC